MGIKITFNTDWGKQELDTDENEALAQLVYPDVDEYDQFDELDPDVQESVDDFIDAVRPFLEDIQVYGFKIVM